MFVRQHTHKQAVSRCASVTYAISFLSSPLSSFLPRRLNSVCVGGRFVFYVQTRLAMCDFFPRQFLVTIALVEAKMAAAFIKEK